MSEYKLVSKGRVVEDKPRGTDYVLVTPIEILYDQPSGKVKDFKDNQLGKLLSIGSANFDTEHEATSIIRAKWKPIGSTNRMTAPDLYVNETVNIYQYGDNTEEYYWDKESREHGLRGREDVVYAWSNRDGGDPDTKPSMEESYTFRVNTHDKYIELRTTANDGEATSYDIKIDTKAGIITITDGLENNITLNSVDGKLTANINEDVEINTKRVVINAEETYTINTKNYYLNADTQSDTVTPLATYSEDVHIHHNLEVDNDETIHGNSRVDENSSIGMNEDVGMHLNVGGNISGGTGSGGGTGTFNGNLRTTGDLETDSNMNVKGNTTIDGDLTVSGTATGRYPGPKE